MRRLRHAVLCVFALFALACSGPNVNVPRGNAVGTDRIDSFNTAAWWVLDHTEDGRLTGELPEDLRPKNLLEVRVGKGKVVGFRFGSAPLDSDPIYIFVDASVTDPLKEATDFMRDQTGWHDLNKLAEPGWYFCFGM